MVETVVSTHGNYVSLGGTETAGGDQAGLTVSEVISMPAGPYTVEQGGYDSYRLNQTAVYTPGHADAFLHRIVFEMANGGVNGMHIMENNMWVWNGVSGGSETILAYAAGEHVPMNVELNVTCSSASGFYFRVLNTLDRFAIIGRGIKA